MEFLIERHSQEEWDRLVESFADLSLLQTWPYGEARSRLGPWAVERGVFVAGDGVAGAAQVLVRTTPVGSGMAWINRAPLWRRDGGEPRMLAAMLAALKHHYVGARGLYLRVVPPVRDGEVVPKELEDSGLRWDSRVVGWASARLDLSVSEDVLRRGLEQKWRNGLNKAERSGLTVDGGTADALFEEFRAQYALMLRRRPFDASVTPDLLAGLHRFAPPAHRPYVALARRDGAVVAGVLIARYGATGEYLAGVTTPAGRAENAGQLLLWHAVCELRRLGHRWFDVGGMHAQHTPPGIYHFKAGLGGDPYTLVGEFEAMDRRWTSQLIRWAAVRARRAAGV